MCDKDNDCPVCSVVFSEIPERDGIVRVSESSDPYAPFDNRRAVYRCTACGACFEQTVSESVITSYSIHYTKLYDFQRVDHVARGLRHLLALLVADELMQIDGVEGHLAGHRQLHHHHPRHPEEQDVDHDPWS